jgi:hypothetical protein
MKVYILFATKYENTVEKVFLRREEAEKERDSASKDWIYVIEEHEVIE